MELGSQTLDAFSEPEKIKKSLTFHNDDALDNGMQKVQPLPFLDEEIKKYVAVIVDSIPAAEQVGDDVPKKVLEIVQAVMLVAREGKTTLFKASDVLELTTEAYQYARTASLDNFQLYRDSVGALGEYDRAFKRMIQNRIDQKVDDADYDKRECREHLEKAVRLAEEDKTRLADRTQREAEELSDSLLSSTAAETKQNLKDEENDLNGTVERCNEDIGTIKTKLEKFDAKITKTMDEQLTERNENETRLQENRKEQRRLEEKLRRLKMEEESLVNSIDNGEHIQEQLVVAKEQVHQEVEQWKASIEELKKRTNTALDIVHRMEECTDLILANAKDKKQEWKTELNKMEVDNLCSYRNALVAQGVFFDMMLKESDSNLTSVVKEIDSLEDDKRTAARTGFTIKVKELNQQVRKYTSHKETFEEEKTQMTDLLSGVKVKLADVDARLQTLCPNFKLESFEGRCEQWKTVKDQAFAKNSTSDVNFDSAQKYNTL